MIEVGESKILELEALFSTDREPIGLFLEGVGLPENELHAVVNDTAWGEVLRRIAANGE